MNLNIMNKLPKFNRYKLRKYKFVIISVIAVILVAIVAGGFLLYKDKVLSNAENVPKATTSLTPDIVAKLQTYPCSALTPQFTLKKMSEEDIKVGNEIVNILFPKVVKFKEGEKFFTDGKLGYMTKDEHFAVRGMLQKKSNDGIITEQYVEYEFKFDNWEAQQRTLVFVQKRLLSEEKIVRGDEQ